MSITPQIETAEIADAVLDNVAGGQAGGAAVSGGLAGTLSGGLSGAVSAVACADFFAAVSSEGIALGVHTHAAAAH